MKEKKTSGDVGRIYRVGGAAGKAGNCENPGECKKSAGICLCRAEQEGAQKGTEKRGKNCQ